MHILLTDVLTCPRCGPEFGLVLLADAVEERRVRAGVLGCANCREHFPVREGVADLRPAGPAGVDPAPGDAAAAIDESGRRAGISAEAGEDGASGTEGEAYRLAALMGVPEGPGLLLIVGPDAVLAEGVAAVVPGVEVVAAGSRAALRTPGTSPVLVGSVLPFFSKSFSAVALSGTAASGLLEEGARVVRSGGRLVVRGYPPEAEERLARVGFRLLARDLEVLVAAAE